MDSDAALWPTPIRYLAAFTAGWAWALLWFGLHRSEQPDAFFWLLGLLLFVPVFAFLARSLGDLLGILGAAWGVAFLVSAALVEAFSATGGSLVRISADLAGRAALAWLPTWLGVALLWTVRRRRRRRSAPQA